ncbi:DMT family transporter [Peribacillus deserti]|uniref:EamA family transporter n=1 Tax=Peribacillus deserti TaxID=673318 RepID=A0A2N5M5S8_9BACI|nr:DMT family transporter [Peribacillus deserti]PLT29710.1 EamA family transporter [Peribacillus deserti]
MKKSSVYLFLILANLFWAGNYVFGKYVVAEMPPLQLTFTRWLIAAVLLFPLAQIIEKPNWKTVWKEWRILLILSILGIVGYNFLLYEALRFTTSLNAAIVNSMNPALIVLFSALFLKESMTRINGLGLVISLLGVLLVLTKGQLQQLFQLDYNQGDLIMLAVILVWTLYSIIGRKIRHIPPISATAASVLIALGLLLPFVLTADLNYSFSSQALTGIIYIGIFPSVGSFIFWNISINHIGASKAAIYLNLLTVFTAIISILTGNSITFPQILGGLLVFIGIYLSSHHGTKIKAKG